MFNREKKCQVLSYLLSPVPDICSRLKVGRGREWKLSRARSPSRFPTRLAPERPSWRTRGVRRGGERKSEMKTPSGVQRRFSLCVFFRPPPLSPCGLATVRCSYAAEEVLVLVRRSFPPPVAGNDDQQLRHLRQTQHLSTSSEQTVTWTFVH